MAVTIVTSLFPSFARPEYRKQTPTKRSKNKNIFGEKIIQKTLDIIQSNVSIKISLKENNRTKIKVPNKSLYFNYLIKCDGLFLSLVFF